MVDTSPLERRVHPRRTAGQWCRLAHQATGRSFRCRFADVSAAGARLVVPPTMPVRVGHLVHLDTPGPEGGPATVVRVQRGNLVREGGVSVAVRFAPATAPDGPSGQV